MTFFPKIRIKRLILYGLFCLFILLAASPFIIIQAMNTDFIRTELSAFVRQKTGIKIKPSQFTLSAFPRPGLEITHLNLTPHPRINLSIDRLNFNVNIRRLLHGKINIDRINIDHPIIEIIDLKESRPVSSVDFGIPKSGLWLKKIFELLPDHQNSLKLSFKNGASPYFKQLDGSFFLSKEKNELGLNTRIKDIQVSRPGTLFNKSFERHLDVDLIKMDELNITSTLNSAGEIQGQCDVTALVMRAKDKSVLLESDAVFSSFKLSDDLDLIDVPLFKLNYPAGRAGVHFSNDKQSNKTGLEFTGSGIYIDQAKKMSLTLFRDNEITRNLFSILHKGIASQVKVSFQDKTIKDLLNGHNLRLAGNIREGLVHIPQTRLTASQVSGHADVKNGILDILVNSAMTQTSRIETGKLSFNLLDHDNVPFQGDFSLDVDLSMVPKTLISLLPDTTLARELSLCHNITGRARAHLGLSLGIDSNDLEVSVQTDDFSIMGRYDRIPGEIYLERVNFRYDKEVVNLNHLNGVINSSQIYDLNLTLDFNDEAWISVQSGSAVISLKSMIPWLMSHERTRNMISPVKTGTGRVHITAIDLSGPVLKPEQWTYHVKGFGQKINATTHLGQEEIQALSCRYEASDDSLELKDIHVRMKDLSWLDPLVEKKHLSSIVVPLDMENGHLQIQEKNVFFKGGIIATGRPETGPEISVVLKGETFSLPALDTIKIIDKGFSDASVTFNHSLEKPLFDFKGILTTKTIERILIPDSFLAKKLDNLTEGRPILIHTDETGTLNVIIQTMNLNSIFPSSEAKSTSPGRRLLPINPIKLKADQLKFKHLTLTDIDTSLSFKDKLSYIRLNNARLCGVLTKGDIHFSNNRVQADIPFKAEDKPDIQNLLSCLFQTDNFMAGPYSLTGNIHANSPKESVLNTLTGSIQFNAQNGRIYKWTLLSRILSVLNVSNFFKGNIPDVMQEGFAYNDISIEADIRASVIHLNSAVIDGRDMTLIFTGRIDPVNDKLDLTCLVAPFKTVDLIIEKIPLINTLLSGRLVSIPIKASGNLFDPVVIPLHPSAVGTGLVNMMADILKTPVKLWDKIYGE